MATPHTYHLQEHLLGACSCDWGCPCSFEARPTQGWWCSKCGDTGIVSEYLFSEELELTMKRR